MKYIKRVVSTEFWEDSKIVTEFSPEDKYFYLYLMTNPHTTQLGIYVLIPKKASFELGYSEDAVKVLLDRFENKYQMIKYNSNTSEIAIKNYLRHSIVKGGKPVLDCLIKEASNVKDINLLIYIINNISKYNNINNTVLSFINYINNNIINNINNNINDNERYVDESSTIRKSTKKSFEKPTIDEVDAYCLKKNYEYVDPEAFVMFYESNGWMVGKNKMKSWHAAVGGWNARHRDSGKKKYKRITPKEFSKCMNEPEPEMTDEEWYEMMVGKYGEENERTV